MKLIGTVVMLLLSVSSYADVSPITFASFSSGCPMHGVDGDASVLLVTVTDACTDGTAPGVYAFVHGATTPLGALPSPAAGWRVPFHVRALAAIGGVGIAYVQDNPPPAAAGTQPAMLYIYAYAAVGGRLNAQLLKSVTMPLGPSGIFFPGEFTLLPDGGVAVADIFTGAVWVTGADLSSWRVGLTDSRLTPDFTPVFTTVTGRAQSGSGTQSYPFASITPGAHSATYATLTDELVFNAVKSPGGIFAIARTALEDQSMPPDQKTALIRSVVPSQAGLTDFANEVEVERLTFQPSHWVFWQRINFNGVPNDLYRANLQTGAVEHLASGFDVYDFTNGLSARSAGFGRICIASAMGQDENNRLVNPLLGGVSQYVSPTPLAEVCLSE